MICCKGSYVSKKCDFKILSIYEMGICVNLRIFLFTEDTSYWIYKLYLNNIILHLILVFHYSKEEQRALTLHNLFLFFRSITRSYYRNSVGGFLVFDITNRRSFEHVKDWLEEAKMHVQPFHIIFLLVGHKCDLASQRQVSREEAEKLSTDCGMKYIETSAKDATNVEESFTILTRDIYELIKKGEICIQDGWEGVKSGFVPNTVHSSEEAVKPRRECFC